MATPTCLGIIDACPAAQGSIWIRFWEMCLADGDAPYRYDVHVKRADGGILTEAEINAQTYYARSFHADELYGCGSGSPGGGSPGGGPGILQALIAFESPGDITAPVIPNDENMHLMTNRQYYIAVRAVAIDAGNVIYEDDNDAVAVSYSSGHQGELWTQILNCVEIEGCGGGAVPVSGTINSNIVNDVLNILGSLDVTGMPENMQVTFPPVDMVPRGGDKVGG